MSDIVVSSYAGLAASMIELAYEISEGKKNLSDFGNQFSITGETRILRNAKLGVDAIFCRREGVSILVIPGTNEQLDWLQNLNFWRVIWPKGNGLRFNLRKGFAMGGKWLWEEFNKHAGKDDRLCVFGHSLGAAQATCVAAYGMFSYLRFESVLAFASPRVASPASARLLDSIYDCGQRYSLGVDIVPLSVLPFFLRFVFDSVHISWDGTYSEKASRWNEIKHAIREKGVQLISDHSISDYKEWAEKVAPWR